MPRKGPPDWFRSIDWKEANVDCEDLGYGSVTLKDAPYAVATRWWKSTERGKEDHRPTAMLLQAYVQAGTDTRIPPQGSNVTKWEEWLKDESTPNKLVYRLTQGIKWFTKSEDDEEVENAPN